MSRGITTIIHDDFAWCRWICPTTKVSYTTVVTAKMDMIRREDGERMLGSISVSDKETTEKELAKLKETIARLLTSDVLKRKDSKKLIGDTLFLTMREKELIEDVRGSRKELIEDVRDPKKELDTTKVDTWMDDVLDVTVIMFYTILRSQLYSSSLNCFKPVCVSRCDDKSPTIHKHLFTTLAGLRRMILSCHPDTSTVGCFVCGVLSKDVIHTGKNGYDISVCVSSACSKKIEHIIEEAHFFCPSCCVCGSVFGNFVSVSMTDLVCSEECYAKNLSVVRRR
jgi:hypothetical protein